MIECIKKDNLETMINERRKIPTSKMIERKKNLA